MSSKQSATPRVSDAAVQAKTGKTWAEWFKVLDAAGAQKLTHKEIAAFLYEKLKVPGWWAPCSLESTMPRLFRMPRVFLSLQLIILRDIYTPSPWNGLINWYWQASLDQTGRSYSQRCV